MTAQNRAGNGEVSAPSESLVVREPVTGKGPLLVEPMRDVYCDTSDSVKMKCRVTGEPTPELTWYIDMKHHPTVKLKCSARKRSIIIVSHLFSLLLGLRTLVSWWMDVNT